MRLIGRNDLSDKEKIYLIKTLLTKNDLEKFNVIIFGCNDDLLALQIENKKIISFKYCRLPNPNGAPAKELYLEDDILYEISPEAKRKKLSKDQELIKEIKRIIFKLDFEEDKTIEVEDTTYPVYLADLKAWIKRVLSLTNPFIQEDDEIMSL